MEIVYYILYVRNVYYDVYQAGTRTNKMENVQKVLMFHLVYVYKFIIFYYWKFKPKGIF